MNTRMLVLENGKTFLGKGFGANETRIAELVFNTSMVGYQEIISDPAYRNCMLCMSYPIIGNYGLTDDDFESKAVHISGMIVREYNDSPSNFRFTRTLAEVLRDNGAPGIEGIDTREIVRIIRTEGSMRAMITDAGRDVDECVKEIKAYNLVSHAVKEVSSKSVWYARTRNPQFTVGIIDCGVRSTMIRKFKNNGCNAVVFPFDATKEEILKHRPQGLFISDGPDAPSSVMGIADLIKEFKGKLPIMGIGLGAHLIAYAYGAKIAKMKVGHNGANQPVKNILTGEIEITSQNHIHVIDKDSLEGTGLTLTHTNIIDGTAEGVIDKDNYVIAMQYHPAEEGMGYLFEQFINFMKKIGGRKNAKENRY